MKTAKDVLTTLFDDGFLTKAQNYSKLFDSWAEITANNKIPSAAAHSRIRGLNKGILLVETDHPGWKQIIQTKLTELLDDFRARFPEMDISGISLMLGYSDEALYKNVCDDHEEQTAEPQEKQSVAVLTEETLESVKQSFDSLKDENFKLKLEELGHIVAERNT
ncbi:MAG: DUF721 domain-containing protein [Treponema sp.]|jgi:hypothetical protein|nr:DUF721 domain-containing protein [Treponema sp.]